MVLEAPVLVVAPQHGAAARLKAWLHKKQTSCLSATCWMCLPLIRFNLYISLWRLTTIGYFWGFHFRQVMQWSRDTLTLSHYAIPIVKESFGQICAPDAIERLIGTQPWLFVYPLSPKRAEARQTQRNHFIQINTNRTETPVRGSASASMDPAKVVAIWEDWNWNEIEALKQIEAACCQFHPSGAVVDCGPPIPMAIAKVRTGLFSISPCFVTLGPSLLQHLHQITVTHSPGAHCSHTGTPNEPWESLQRGLSTDWQPCSTGCSMA